MPKPRSGPWVKILLCGVLVGAGLFAVLACAMVNTDQRPFCTSCHIMAEAGVTHKMSTHANLACNDCHAPGNLMAKLPFKAREGLRDVIGNMNGSDVPLGAMLSTRAVVKANCIACHARTNVEVASMDVKPYCVDCHRNIAHMRKKPVSSRMVAYG